MCMANCKFVKQASSFRSVCRSILAFATDRAAALVQQENGRGQGISFWCGGGRNEGLARSTTV